MSPRLASARRCRPPWGEAFRRSEDGREIGEGLLVLLRGAANPLCSSCRGDGVEVQAVDDLPELNLNQGNARALLTALGLPMGGPEMMGRVPLPVARRAAWGALNRGRSKVMAQALEVRKAKPAPTPGGVRVVTCELAASALLVPSWSTVGECTSVSTWRSSHQAE